MIVHPDDVLDAKKKILESVGETILSYSIEDRPSKTDYYLGIAKAVSRRSTCLRRHYGAVIVNNDEIIATGYNGNPRGMFNCCEKKTCHREDRPHNSGDYSDCFSVHAEQNALLSASRRDMIGGTLYLYGEESDGHIITDVEPCPICMRMIQNSGIRCVTTVRNNKII